MTFTEEKLGTKRSQNMIRVTLSLSGRAQTQTSFFQYLGSAQFSIKGQKVHSLGFAGHTVVCVTTTQLCWCSG